MSPKADKRDNGATAQVLSWCRDNRHFLAAGLIVACTAVAVRAVGWTEKLPVPWPEGVRVGEDWRLESPPLDKIGPFELERGDGVVRKRDGKPDGEVVLRSADLKALGIGTSYDSDRYPHGSSNWYVARIYRDTRRRAPDRRRHDPYSHWQLEVYYYTGIRDKAPHIPERCLLAGGVTIVSSGGSEFEAPRCPGPWNRTTFRRTVYERSVGNMARPFQGVEYYVFSLDGKPTNTPEAVRLHLANPLVRYCYFAKIQFSPAGIGGIRDLNEADSRAQEFVKHFLPEVLKVLPTTEAVGRLGSGKQK